MLKGELSPGVRLSFGALTMGIVGRVGELVGCVRGGSWRFGETIAWETRAG
jgi:hypothetical protein